MFCIVLCVEPSIHPATKSIEHISAGCGKKKTRKQPNCNLLASLSLLLSDDEKSQIHAFQISPTRRPAIQLESLAQTNDTQKIAHKFKLWSCMNIRRSRGRGFLNPMFETICVSIIIFFRYFFVSASLKVTMTSLAHTSANIEQEMARTTTSGCSLLNCRVCRWKWF